MDNSGNRKCMKKKMKIYLRYILIYFYLIFLIYKNETGNMLVFYVLISHESFSVLIIIF